MRHQITEMSDEATWLGKTILDNEQALLHLKAVFLLINKINPREKRGNGAFITFHYHELSWNGGRVDLGSQSECPVQGASNDMTAGAWHFLLTMDQNASKGQQSGAGYKILRPHPTMPRFLYNLHKTASAAGNQMSNLWAWGGHFTFKPWHTEKKG